jgi:hypothetical protein
MQRTRIVRGNSWVERILARKNKGQLVSCPEIQKISIDKLKFTPLPDSRHLWPCRGVLAPALELAARHRQT